MAPPGVVDWNFNQKRIVREIKMDAPTFEIVKTIACISTEKNGWTKELNLVSWNDREPKYDIREWAPDKSKMGKGITLSNEEAAVLKKALDSRKDI